MRKGLAESQARAWAAIAAPGTWLTGERRVAVCAEVRNARGCPQCARIKTALSPNVAGDHDSLGRLGLVEFAEAVVARATKRAPPGRAKS